ncbi:RrF2 family transcriptional regulator [Luteimicrobium xylanilyticum]|uniref:HTH-type transcriptional regulator n=1 Tax=Luteimicrobium xylanilyticum TaxID=1133546 RepID=A0A5P9Q9B8_9MICO|nr:Rrf2 family transcriptional regulator [Luteimicrobium xylanilyticum]QFU98031.1 Putative HTH-type transcriptional regulator [Luteimicrobium xylanilyticum]
MRISSKTDTAVRACVELAARHEAGTPYIKATTVAEAQELSLSFVLVLLNELKQAGLVESRRGSDGGYRLAASPDRIVVADVVRAIDGPLANVAGSHVEDVAYGGAAGSVRDLWVALRASIRTVLDEVTLHDLAAGTMPPDVAALIDDEDAWRTRPNGRRVGAGIGRTPPRPSVPGEAS